MGNWRLKIDASDSESLLQLFFEKKNELNAKSTTVLLSKLSKAIPNEVLMVHKASILEMIQFTREFEIEQFDTVSIATFFNALSKWPSLLAEPLCTEVIHHFLPYIIKRAIDFKSQSISNVLNALAKCPLSSHSSNSELFKKAINALLKSATRQSFGSQDVLLIALAFCYFTYFGLLDFDSHQEKIRVLLKTLTLKALGPIAMNQFHQIFIYAPTLMTSTGGALSHLSHKALKQYLETAYTLEQPNSSLLHQEVFRYLKACPSPTFSDKVFINEYKIGHTFVDIACPKEQVCIQVNGPDHYVGEDKQEYLNNRSQFTQYLLEKQDWTVLNIKYTDWNNTTKENKIVYLSKVIGPYLKSIEPPSNPTRQEQAMQIPPPPYLQMPSYYAPGMLAPVQSYYAFPPPSPYPPVLPMYYSTLPPAMPAQTYYLPISPSHYPPMVPWYYLPVPPPLPHYLPVVPTQTYDWHMPPPSHYVPTLPAHNYYVVPPQVYSSTTAADTQANNLTTPPLWEASSLESYNNPYNFFKPPLTQRAMQENSVSNYTDEQSSSSPTFDG